MIRAIHRLHPTFACFVASTRHSDLRRGVTMLGAALRLARLSSVRGRWHDAQPQRVRLVMPSFG
jgi:hypothetical protein